MTNRSLRKKRITTHEAGHAVVAYLINCRITEIRLYPSYHAYNGSVDTERPVDIGDRVLISCAGNAAQYLLAGHKYWSRSSQDYINAYNSLSWLYGYKEEITACIDLYWICAKNMVAEPENWSAVNHLARALERNYPETPYLNEYGDEDDNDGDYLNFVQMDGSEAEEIIRKAIEMYRLPQEEELFDAYQEPS